jgi:lysine 6-dehydrogenase
MSASREHRNKRVVVLGGGLIGAVIAADLAEDPTLEVTLADLRADEMAPMPQLTLRAADLSTPQAIKELAETADVVVGALPSRFGRLALEAVIAAKRPYADISFMEQDPRELDAMAKAAGVTCIYDCGVAPGMSNVLSAHAAKQLDRCERLTIYVGGLPRERRWPFEYKAGFAPYDVFEEYTRPARVMIDGEVVIKEALSEPELCDFDGLGHLEAFNTDGLRSLLDTLEMPQRLEKTLRYPGHIELMRVLRHAGFFDEQPVSVGDGQQVVPRELTAALLSPKWTFEPGEADLTVMRVLVDGEKDGVARRIRFELRDDYDPRTGRTSMSRTTGYPAAIVARMLASGRLHRPGVHPPEALATDDDLVAELIAAQAERGVVYRRFDEAPEG